MRTLFRYLYPRFPVADLLPIVGIALLTALLSGIYGILHDQITYSISPEYYTKLKFAQFAWADVGLSDRWLVSTIGFVATSWVGLIAGWLLARRFVHGQPRSFAYRQIAKGLACTVGFAAAFGVCAYTYGLWHGPNPDLSSSWWFFEYYYIIDLWAFVRVAYIHNAGYVGAAFGLIVALLVIPVRAR